MSTETRRRLPAVSGTFYPSDAAALRALVDADLAQASTWTGPVPKALVVPHAGYMFSGPIVATGYATLAGARALVHRVVLLGPAHYVAVAGLAVSGVDALVTPIGAVPVDDDLRRRVLAMPGVEVDDAAHAPEHSLEVHLPFLLRALDHFTVLPILVGRAAPEAVAAVLDAVWGGPETLIVVSSDLSHYLDHETATQRDRATARAVVAGDAPSITSEDACGATPLRGLLRAAATHDLRAQLLDLRNSGDTAGPRDHVVGYGAFAFLPTPNPLFVR